MEVGSAELCHCPEAGGPGSEGLLKAQWMRRLLAGPTQETGDCPGCGQLRPR